MPGGITIATWNTEWISRRSKSFEAATDRIERLDADILVLTDATVDLIPVHGYSALGGVDWGYPGSEIRRKVILWSRWPIEAPITDAVEPPGRHISANVISQEGPLRLHAACVPWRDAHVSAGRGDAKPWSEHLSFLESLQNVLLSERENDGLVPTPVVFAGDFNQRDGDNPYRSPETAAAWSRLLEAADLREVTPSEVIDRIAVSADLTATKTGILDPDGISDHHAVSACVERSPDAHSVPG